MIEHDEAAALARRILALRMRRVDHLPRELLGEHAWCLLLVLFIADTEGRRITALEAAGLVGAPPSLADRWLRALEGFGLVACPSVCADGHQVALTPAGIHAVERCMEDGRELMSIKEIGRRS